MLFKAVFAAWRQVFSTEFRRILWRSLGLTLALLALVWASLRAFFNSLLAGSYLSEHYPILDGYILLLSSLGLFFLFLYLLPAVTAIVAGFFIDDAAAIVEETDFPNDPKGKPAPFLRSMISGLRFAGLSLLVNLVALAFFFLPGINLFVFFLANAYLLGREYFELAAGRFLSPEKARLVRVNNRFTVLCAGAVMALLILVPIINLLTPLFGIALMVHVHKGLNRHHP